MTTETVQQAVPAEVYCLQAVKPVAVASFVVVQPAVACVWLLVQPATVHASLSVLLPYAGLVLSTGRS